MGVETQKGNIQECSEADKRKFELNYTLHKTSILNGCSNPMIS
ncbi:2607_t:CDS:1 [Racocetra persica]|uniref:2607_t:CDS:1 n=1 Tax=Racocetra persica TaxID=160502 RepID=A0ACA9L2W6_9GLOM|nr:2607_t:CDS:1 [Racocetra persica]